MDWLFWAFGWFGCYLIFVEGQGALGIMVGIGGFFALKVYKMVEAERRGRF